MSAQLKDTPPKATRVARIFKEKLVTYLSQFPGIVMIMHIDFGVAVVLNADSNLTMYTATELWMFQEHVQKAPSIVLDGIQEIIFRESIMDTHSLVAFIESNLKKKSGLQTQKNRRELSSRAFRAREEYVKNSRIAAYA